MSKNKNYTNYYSKSTYNKKEVEDKPQKEEVQEEVVETKPEKFPEGNFEKTEQKPVLPDRGELVENLYIRESPDGPKVPKDELDRFLSSKVIKDIEGNAIVPKGARIDIFDMTEAENGVVWYNTNFGYLMARNKSRKEYIKAVQ